jgi:hypothetical protein
MSLLLLHTHAGPEENFVYHGEEGRLTRCNAEGTISIVCEARTLRREE